jgi:tRNA dimethylallyltransferase
MSSKINVITITGQTGTGKTSLALDLAKQIGGELISADSRQVYTALNIGTGKYDNPAQLVQHGHDWLLDGVPIHGINLIAPDQIFSAGDFAMYAQSKIAEIVSRNKVPIIVGGTGFYIKSLICPDETISIPPDLTTRNKYELLEKEYSHDPAGFVRLLQKDLELLNKNKLDGMNNSDRNNPRRLVRAIEVALTVPRSDQKFSNKKFRFQIVALKAPAEFLEAKVSVRVKEMLKQGYESEVRGLVEKFGWNIPALKTIGYLEWQAYFNNQATIDQTVQQIIRSHLQYSRKQLLYLQRLINTNWIDVSDPKWKISAIEYCKNVA